jgi:rhodanese-related sulfurtransferase
MRIPPDELARLMRGSSQHAVLDLRERAAYERGHIYWSTSLPRRLLEFRLPALVSARATPVVVVDDDGRLAALAEQTVRDLGYTDVRTLALRDWRAAARPLVSGLNVPSKAFGERVLHEQATPSLNAAQLVELRRVDPDVVVLDSRTPEEYTRGTIPGAIGVPGGELALRIGDLTSSPDTTIVVTCGGRTRSIIGTESLRALELPNPLYSLENGTMGWELAGLELERGAARRPPALSAASRAQAEAVAVELAIPSLSPQELRRLWERRAEENVQIVDVRSAEEHEAGRIPGSSCVPGGQAVQATDDAVAVRAATVVLVCDGTVRSTMTARWLRELGLPNVLTLAGGLPAWVDARGEVETGPLAAGPAGWPDLDVRVLGPDELRRSSAVVVDVDESARYVAGHVPGAAWICRSRLELLIGERVPDRSAQIVVTCSTGYSSALAARTLVDLGYRSAAALAGGNVAWACAGYPLEAGATTLWDGADDVVLKPYEKGREAIEAYLAWEIDLDIDALEARGGE